MSKSKFARIMEIEWKCGKNIEDSWIKIWKFQKMIRWTNSEKKYDWIILNKFLCCSLYIELCLLL